MGFSLLLKTASCCKCYNADENHDSESKQSYGPERKNENTLTVACLFENKR